MSTCKDHKMAAVIRYQMDSQFVFSMIRCCRVIIDNIILFTGPIEFMILYEYNFKYMYKVYVFSLKSSHSGVFFYYIYTVIILI